MCLEWGLNARYFSPLKWFETHCYTIVFCVSQWSINIYWLNKVKSPRNYFFNWKKSCRPFLWLGVNRSHLGAGTHLATQNTFRASCGEDNEQEPSGLEDQPPGLLALQSWFAGTWAFSSKSAKPPGKVRVESLTPSQPTSRGSKGDLSMRRALWVGSELTGHRQLILAQQKGGGFDARNRAFCRKGLAGP